MIKAKESEVTWHKKEKKRERERERERNGEKECGVTCRYQVCTVYTQKRERERERERFSMFDLSLYICARKLCRCC